MAKSSFINKKFFVIAFLFVLLVGGGIGGECSGRRDFPVGRTGMDGPGGGDRLARSVRVGCLARVGCAAAGGHAGRAGNGQTRQGDSRTGKETVRAGHDPACSVGRVLDIPVFERSRPRRQPEPQNASDGIQVVRSVPGRRHGGNRDRRIRACAGNGKIAWIDGCRTVVRGGIGRGAQRPGRSDERAADDAESVVRAQGISAQAGVRGNRSGRVSSRRRGLDGAPLLQHIAARQDAVPSPAGREFPSR